MAICLLGVFLPMPAMSVSPDAAPLVSVIMPAYNAEQYIGEAIESILHQTFRDFELIIIDDGSNDGTLHVIQSYAQRDKRIVVVSSEQNGGVGHARNLGLARARGELIALMDADDISLSHRLDAQVRFLRAHPKVGLVGGAILFVDAQKKPIAERRFRVDDAAIRKVIFLLMPCCMGSAMIRKNVFLQVGVFDTDYPVAEDYELCFRIGRVAQFANLEEILFWYRRRPGSLTHERMRAVEHATIALKRVYFREYRATALERIVNNLHLLSLYLVPCGWKQWLLFNVRNFFSKSRSVHATPATRVDRMYNVLHRISLFVCPVSWRRWLFCPLRQFIARRAKHGNRLC